MRIGLELELVAPPGVSRDDVAAALARAFAGDVRYGLKHVVDGEIAAAQPRCRLTRAARVEVSGRWLCDVVDDNTLRAGLERGLDRAPVVVVDDTRFAKWLERRAWGPDPAVEARLAPLVETFEGRVERGAPARVIDPWGQVLAVLSDEPAAHQRVSEIVTRPLEDGERADVLGRILEVVRAEALAVPAEAALHAHLDAAPWQSTAALRRLILGWNEGRPAAWELLKPNPRCRKLGAFPALVVRAAEEAGDEMPFAVFCAGLGLAGAQKACDLNILGVIEAHPLQPTLEVRCLPMSLDAGSVLASVDAAVALLAPLGGR